MGRIKHIVAHGQASDALGDIRILEEQFPEDATLAYYAALAKGTTPAHLPEEMHRTLFDNMADKFDQHLVQGLGYQLPKLVAQQLTARHPEKMSMCSTWDVARACWGFALAPCKVT